MYKKIFLILFFLALISCKNDIKTMISKEYFKALDQEEYVKIQFLKCERIEIKNEDNATIGLEGYAKGYFIANEKNISNIKVMYKERRESKLKEAKYEEIAEIGDGNKLYFFKTEKKKYNFGLGADFEVEFVYKGKQEKIYNNSGKRYKVGIGPRRFNSDVLLQDTEILLVNSKLVDKAELEHNHDEADHEEEDHEHKDEKIEEDNLGLIVDKIAKEYLFQGIVVVKEPNKDEKFNVVYSTDNWKTSKTFELIFRGKKSKYNVFHFNIELNGIEKVEFYLENNKDKKSYDTNFNRFYTHDSLNTYYLF